MINVGTWEWDVHFPVSLEFVSVLTSKLYLNVVELMNKVTELDSTYLFTLEEG